MSKLKDYYKDKIFIMVSFHLSGNEIRDLKSGKEYVDPDLGKKILKSYEADLAFKELVNHTEQWEIE